MALKASPAIQSQLLDIQAIDTRMQQLDHKARSLPELKAISGHAAQAEVINRQLRAESGAVEDARLELGRIEADVVVVEARTKRDTERLEASVSVKDVAGLEHELVGLRKRQDDLEEIEFGVMERLEGLEAAVRATRVSLDEIQLQLSASEAERDTALVAVSSESADALANRTAIAGKLPEELLALYERQRARYGFGASLLQGGVSLASGVKLNAGDLDSIRAAAPDDVVICPDSQAILVRTAESGI